MEREVDYKELRPKLRKRYDLTIFLTVLQVIFIIIFSYLAKYGEYDATAVPRQYSSKYSKIVFTTLTLMPTYFYETML